MDHGPWPMMSSMVHGVHGPKPRAPRPEGPRGPCPWTRNNETWSMIHGPWSMAHDVHGVHGPWCPWSKAQSPEAAGPRPRGLVVHVWCPWIINNEPWSMTHGPWSMVGPWPMMSMVSMVSMCRRCNTLDAIIHLNTYVIYYEICSWLGQIPVFYFVKLPFRQK